MRQGQTSLWSACAVILMSLGLSGVVASGCGDDDDNPTGAGGMGGTAGRGGSDAGAGKGGSGGKGGTGGSTSDAPTDVSPTQCRTRTDSGLVCTDECFCNTCPTQIYSCFSAPECANVLACIRRTGCMGLEDCPVVCAAEVGAAGAWLSLLTNPTFQGCLMTCSTSCADAGSDAGPDATPDVTPDNTPQPDATPDTTPDTTPDVTPDTAPDVTPDTLPDVMPDTTMPDVAQDTTMPDVMPDTRDATPDTSDAADGTPG